MDRCKTCQHWTKNDEAWSYARHGGECQSGNLLEDGGPENYRPNNLVYSYSEGGSFWTGPEFGCIHHKPLANK